MPRALHKQYQKQWTKAKEEYHTATGSKRPGENRLWGLFGDRFQKSTEIGDACKLVDDALENITDKKTGLATKKGIDKAKEALANLTAKKDTYLTRLDRDLEVEGHKARGTPRQGDEGIEEVAYHRREEAGPQGSESGGEGVG